MPQPTDKDWLIGYENKIPIYAVYKRPTSKQETHTDWKWRAEKDISHKWRPKESRSSNTHIRLNRLWNKGCEKRQRTLHNDQRINPRRRYNNYKYIHTQHRSTANVRQMLTNMKGEINNNTIIVGDFNTLFIPMDRSTKQKINKEMQTLNDTIDQLDLIDIYRTFTPKQWISPFSQVLTEPSPG